MTRSILYLHGHNDSPSKPPGDAVLRHPFGFPVHAPSLGNFWLSDQFDRYVDSASGWMAESVLAIGHSTGAWLALCAAAARSDFPHMLLLSPCFGKSGKVSPGTLSSNPNKWTVLRQDMGLEGLVDRSPFGIDRITVVAPRQDNDFHTAEDLSRLAALGYCVTKVPGDSTLSHPIARKVIADVLWQYAKILPSASKPAAKSRPRERVFTSARKKRSRSFSA